MEISNENFYAFWLSGSRILSSDSLSQSILLKQKRQELTDAHKINPGCLGQTGHQNMIAHPEW